MPDREKVINDLLEIRKDYEDMRCKVSIQIINDACAMLKEQEEREKAICKEICNFIRGSCSTDTYSDKEYVCHVVQQMFIKGWR